MLIQRKKIKLISSLNFRIFNFDFPEHWQYNVHNIIYIILICFKETKILQQARFQLQHTCFQDLLKKPFYLDWLEFFMNTYEFFYPIYLYYAHTYQFSQRGWSLDIPPHEPYRAAYLDRTSAIRFTIREPYSSYLCCWETKCISFGDSVGLYKNKNIRITEEYKWQVWVAESRIKGGRRPAAHRKINYDRRGVKRHLVVARHLNCFN